MVDQTFDTVKNFDRAQKHQKTFCIATATATAGYQNTLVFLTAIYAAYVFKTNQKIHFSNFCK